MLVDTHAHIHFDEFKADLAGVFKNCRDSGVVGIICVGVDDEDSLKALNFVTHPAISKLAQDIKLYATVGLHPHEANRGTDALLSIKELIIDQESSNELVAVGECGLDYYRNLSSKVEQLKVLEFQIELAEQQNLPVVFHVRDAWDDFFAVIANHPKVRGVIHSFTGGPDEVEKASKYELYFGLNGIVTFTKEAQQLEAAKLIPANRLLLETDCPYLTPTPMRGKRNEPGYVSYTAEFLAKLRGVSLSEIANASSANTKTLFKL